MGKILMQLIFSGYPLENETRKSWWTLRWNKHHVSRYNVNLL